MGTWWESDALSARRAIRHAREAPAGRRAGGRQLTDVHCSLDVAALKVGITHIDDAHTVVVGPAKSDGGSASGGRGGAGGSGSWGLWRSPLAAAAPFVRRYGAPAGRRRARGEGGPHREVYRPSRATKPLARRPIAASTHPRSNAFTRAGARMVTALAVHAILPTKQCARLVRLGRLPGCSRGVVGTVHIPPVKPSRITD